MMSQISILTRLVQLHNIFQIGSVQKQLKSSGGCKVEPRARRQHGIVKTKLNSPDLTRYMKESGHINACPYS